MKKVDFLGYALYRISLMQYILEMYINYLAAVRGLTENTRSAYYQDLENYLTFLQERRVNEIGKVQEADVLEYRAWLQGQ